MRKAFAFVCATALTATVTSCVSDGGEQNSSYGVSFTAGIKRESGPAALTRTTNGGDEWVAGDGVGIYMLQAGGVIPAGVLPNMGNKRYNVTNASSGTLAPDASATPVIEYPVSGASVDFVAYYPHSDEADGRVSGYGIFTVPLTDQSAPEKIDVLTARKTGVTSGPITLLFEHALSKITLNIRLADGVTAITESDVAAIADVKLTSTPGSARVNVATGAVGDGPNAQIALLKAADAATDYEATFSAIVAPTSAGNGGGRYLTIVCGGSSYVWAIPATDIFAPGQNYIYWGEITDIGFRVTESNITEWGENIKGPVADLIPAKVQGNRRITWDAATSRYTLTTDPTNGGLFFKFGSVVGIYSAHAAIRTLPDTNVDSFESANDVAWDPTGAVTSNANAGWSTVPSYVAADYPKTVTPESGYHTIANVKAGKGDPCRLVGLDLARIKSTAAGSLTAADIDNGKWRLPTPAEKQAFSGRETNGDYTEHYTTLNGVKGAMFPNTTIGDATTFLPANGQRYNNSTGNMNMNGYYWSMTPDSDTYGGRMYFNAGLISPSSGTNVYAYGFGVRCVRQ
jgi:hypothetical protein